MNYVNYSKQLNRFPLSSPCLLLSLSDWGEMIFSLGLSFPTYTVTELD